MNSDELALALKPLTDTGRVVITGEAYYDVTLSIDGGDAIYCRIPFDATVDNLLGTLTAAHPELAAVLQGA